MKRADKRSSKRLVIAMSFIAMSILPAAGAEQCSIEAADIDKSGSYGNAVATKVKEASTCERAYRVLEVCQLGSSGDNALSDVVLGKCEPLFLNKASPATKAAYKKTLGGCDQIALKNQGTMYQGFAAVCRAKAARDFARK